MAFVETLALLGLSLLVLVKAAQVTIRNAVGVARLLGISDAAVGFVFVAVATSVPELMVSVMASLRGSPAIAVGNVFGANIADVTWVLGAAAFFGGVGLPRSEHSRLVQILFATSLLSLLLLLFNFGRLTGVFLLLVFCVYICYIFKHKVGLEQAGEGESISSTASASGFVSSSASLLKGMLMLLAGVAVVIISSKYAVDYAVEFALAAGMSQVFIGSVIISLGTTLPELSVSISAIWQKRAGIALGTVLGSCITNLALILGAAMVVNPEVANLSGYAGLVAYSLLSYFLLWYFIGVRRKLGKPEGAALLVVYAAFIAAQLLAAVG